MNHLLTRSVCWCGWIHLLAACWLGQVLPSRAQQPPVKAQAESSPAAVATYSDAANYQNNMAYELAAEEWGRFLERYGNDPLAAKAQHYRGVCLVRLKQFAEAINAFDAVLSQHPKFEMLQETYLNLGWSQYCLAQAGDENRYGQAIETFGKLAESYPKGKYADQALFYRAESFYALGKQREAALVYGKLVTGYPDSTLRPDALYALGVALEEMGQWEQAKKSYGMFAEDYANHGLFGEVQLRLAETILQTGDRQAAAAKFAELAATPGFAAADHALLRQAYCQAREGNDRGAAETYASLVERFGQSTHVAEASLSAARCYYRAEEFEKAANWFDRVLAAEQPSTQEASTQEASAQEASAQEASAQEAAHWRCRIYLQSQQAEEAVKMAEKGLAVKGDGVFTPNLRLDKADALYELPGRQEDARDEYLSIAETYPKHDVAPVALYQAAFAFLESKEYERATELAGQFLASYADHRLTPDVQYIVAECKVQAKAYEEAAAIYRQIIDTAKDHPEYSLWQVRLALILYLEQKSQQAIDLLSPQVDQLAPPSLKAEALYVIGISQLRQGDLSAAADSLRQSLEVDASWSQADETLLYLARAQRQMDQLKEALATLEKLRADYPQSRVLDQADYLLGECHYALRQYPQAIAAYDRVLAQADSSALVPLALYGKGWSHLKSAQYAEANEMLTKLIDRFSDHELHDDALFARGMSYRQMKQYDKAIADVDLYLSTQTASPQRADALYEKGLAESLNGQYQQAIETLDQLTKEAPEYAHGDKVLYEQAWALKSLGEEQAAGDKFAALAEAYPDSSLTAESLFHVGERAYAREDYAEAVKAYQSAADAQDPSLHEKVVYKLGWSYHELGQHAQALETFEALLKGYPDGELVSDGWFMKGESLFEMKEYEKALVAFEQASESEASSPQIGALRQLHAAQAAGQLGKWDKSIRLLDPLLTQQPAGDYAAEAHFERGQAKLKLNQLDAASKDFQAAAEQSRAVLGLRGQFMVGEVAFQQKRYDEAIKEFQRAMFRGQMVGDPQELSNWQAKAGYEAGRCAEVQVNATKSAAERVQRITEAKKYYGYVLEKHADHELAAEAKKRLTALTQLNP